MSTPEHCTENPRMIWLLTAPGSVYPTDLAGTGHFPNVGVDESCGWPAARS